MAAVSKNTLFLLRLHYFSCAYCDPSNGAFLIIFHHKSNTPRLASCCVQPFLEPVYTVQLYDGWCRQDVQCPQLVEVSETCTLVDDGCPSFRQ